jgi:hypothetical protein
MLYEFRAGFIGFFNSGIDFFGPLYRIQAKENPYPNHNRQDLPFVYYGYCTPFFIRITFQEYFGRAA